MTQAEFLQLAWTTLAVFGAALCLFAAGTFIQDKRTLGRNTKSVTESEYFDQPKRANIERAYKLICFVVFGIASALTPRTSPEYGPLGLLLVGLFFSISIWGILGSARDLERRAAKEAEQRRKLEAEKKP